MQPGRANPEGPSAVVKKLQEENVELKWRLRELSQRAPLPAGTFTSQCQADPGKDAETQGLRTKVASLERLLASAVQRADDEHSSHVHLQRQYGRLKVRKYCAHNSCPIILVSLFLGIKEPVVSIASRLLALMPLPSGGKQTTP